MCVGVLIARLAVLHGEPSGSAFCSKTWTVLLPSLCNTIAICGLFLILYLAVVFDVLAALTMPTAYALFRIRGFATRSFVFTLIDSLNEYLLGLILVY